MKLLAALALILLAGLVLASCGDSAPSEAYWRARQAAVDPPELWSVQAIDQPRPVPPIHICADSYTGTGFGLVNPAVGDRACAREGAFIHHARTTQFRCTLNGREFAVWSTVEGDVRHAFTARSRIESLDDGAGYDRVLRFERLGRCPAGWNVGDATDRHGRRISGAVQPAS